MAKRMISAMICIILLICLVPAGMTAEETEPAPGDGAPAAVTAEKAVKPKSIRISGSKYLAKGKKITLKASVLPEGASQKVKWSSSDKTIATVSGKGVVKGIKAGKVTITAKSKANPKVKKTWKLTVKGKAVKSISVSGVQEMNMTSKKEITLKAKAEPKDAAQSFQWKSSNKSVATVSSKGIVKAVAPGTAKITATATDGSKKKKSVTIKVTKVSETACVLDRSHGRIASADYGSRYIQLNWDEPANAFLGTWAVPFVFRKAAGGYYRIVSDFMEQIALTADQGHITGRDINDSDDQLWKFLEAGNGCYYIRSRSGFYLNIDESAQEGDRDLVAGQEAKSRWKLTDYDFAGCECMFLESGTGKNIGIEMLTDDHEVLEPPFNVVYNSTSVYASPGWSCFRLNRMSNTKYFYLTHHAYGQDVYGGEELAITVRDQNIVFEKFLASDKQLWELIDAGNGYFHIRSMNGYYFDLAGSPAATDVNVVPGSSPKYKWRVEVSPGNG